MDKRLMQASKNQRLMEWAQMVKECRSSELTCKAWCTQHGITERKYHYWQKRVFDLAILQREETLTARNEPCFAELPAPEQVCQQPLAPAEIVASVRIGNAAIDLYAGAEPSMVQALCKALKSC